MKKFVFAALAAVAFMGAGAAVHAEDAPKLSRRACMDILAGLESLNYVGQLGPIQMAPNGNVINAPPPGAEHYKLSASALTTIALDIGELGREQAALTKGQQDFERTLGPPPTGDVIKMSAEERQVARDYAKKKTDGLEAVLESDCTVAPGHLKQSELNLGSGKDQNAIPPSVLSLIMPIVDRDK